MRRTIAAAWAAAGAWASARPTTTRTLASSPAPNISPPPRSWRGEGGPREGRRAGTARYLLFLPPTIAAYLCHWQVDRKAWKEGQLERWEAALKADPLPLAALPPSPPELTRVTAAGTLAHDRAMLVGPRSRSVAGGTVSGFLLVTPLVDSEQSTRVVALVVRGWVPAAWATDALGTGVRGVPGAEPAGCITLDHAIVRGAETPSRFVPENKPQEGQWFWLDPPALAAAAGAVGPVPLLEALAPPDAPPAPRWGGAPPPMDVLGGRTGRLGGGGEATTPSGGGGGGQAGAPPPAPRYPDRRRLADLTTVAVTPADHRNYALTWGSLAAATAGLAVKAVRAR